MNVNLKSIVVKVLAKIGLRRYRLFYIKKSLYRLISLDFSADHEGTLGVENWTRIEIGQRSLAINLSIPHENQLYNDNKNGVLDVDTMIAKHLLKKEDVVLDAGANIGATALTFLSLGAKEVHAFEPMPDLFIRLSKLSDNFLVAYEIALSDSSKELDLIVSKSHNQGSTLNDDFVDIHPMVFGQTLTKIKVKTDSVDSLFKEKYFDYIKVDIEGHEIPFVKGASKLFKQRPPRVLQIEIYDDLFSETHALLSPFFTDVRKVIYNKDSKKIKFIPMEKSYTRWISEGYQIYPPNYIYFNGDLLNY